MCAAADAHLLLSHFQNCVILKLEGRTIVPRDDLQEDF